MAFDAGPYQGVLIAEPQVLGNHDCWSQLYGERPNTLKGNH